MQVTKYRNFCNSFFYDKFQFQIEIFLSYALMKKTQKITLLLRASYVVLGLVITIFALDKIIMPMYVSGNELKVPNVVGLEKERAFEILDSVGLDYSIKNTIEVNDPTKDGKILQQKPSNGKIAKEGRVVLLWLGSYRGHSLNDNRVMVEVPDVIGKTFAEAEQILLSSNLNMKLMNKVEKPDPEALVLEQSRPPGEKVAEGSSIWIKLDMPGDVIVDTLATEPTEEDQSSESEMVTMPGLIKLSRQEAIKQLNELGLKVGTITEVESPDHLPGSVVSQSISAGIKVRKGEVVDLQVSASVSDEEIIQ